MVISLLLFVCYVDIDKIGILCSNVSSSLVGGMVS